MKKFLILLALAALPCAGQQKISERTTLAGESIDSAADWFPIVDTSAGSAGDKKTSLAEMWKKLGGTNVSATELGYLDGVTSSVQGQLDEKLANSAAAVASAIAGDPAVVRDAAIPGGFLYNDDFGIISGDSSDVVATANAAALNTALAESSSTRKVLILHGTIYVKGQILASGVGITVEGNGATIVQKDITHNGITLDTVVVPYGLRIINLGIQGQGPATHDAAGIYGRKGDLSYFTSDIILRDVTISGFRKGTNLAGIAKFQTDNLSISNVRIGHEWNHMQTAVCIASRIVTGDSHADSACFSITGGNFFSNKILGGEFGGSGFARFANIISGYLYVEGCNLEAFTSSQTINLSGANSQKLALVNCRVAVSYGASTSSIISAEVNGNAVPVIEWRNNYGWSGSPRQIEAFGTVTRIPTLTGGVVSVTTASTQGGTAVLVTQLSGLATTTGASLPSSGSVSPGGEWVLQTSSTATDEWQTNPLMRVQNNRTGSTEWASANNNLLSKVIDSYGRDTATVSTTETDLRSVTLPAGTLAAEHESLQWEMFGSTGANTNNKTIKFYYGGTERFAFGPFAANDEDWSLSILILKRFTGNSGGVQVRATLTGGTLIGTQVQTASISFGSSLGSVATKITGTGTADNDIIANGSRLVWLRAPSGL